MPKPKMPRFEIGWYDIVGSAEWLSNEDVLEQSPQECWTVGYFVKETSSYITVSCTYSPEGSDQWTGVFSIPKACIFSRKKL